MPEIREAPFTLRFSAYRVMSEFSSPGVFVELIDFRNRIENYLPAGSSLISANIDLVRLQSTHYLPNLYRAQSWSRADPDLDNPADLLATESEWQRKHSVASGYAVQISIGEFSPSNSEWHVIGFKNLYNTGLENYANLLNPILTLGERDYFDLEHQLGFRIAEIPPQITFTTQDRIAITGAANIYATYEYDEPLPTIIDENDHAEINSTAWTRIFSDRPVRVAFYLSNIGDNPVHFLLTDKTPTSGWNAEFYPIIQPGESVTFENGKFFGNSDKILNAYAYHASQNLYCRTVSGTTKVSCQNFYHS